MRAKNHQIINDMPKLVSAGLITEHLLDCLMIIISYELMIDINIVLYTAQLLASRENNNK